MRGCEGLAAIIQGGPRGIHRGGHLVPQLALLLLQLLPDVTLGLADRLQEFGIGSISAAGEPIFLAASVVPGIGAEVERPGRSGQAGGRSRVHARALRAREDRGDQPGQFVSVVEHLRAREELFLVTAHDPAFRYGTSFQRGRARDPRGIVRYRPTASR